MAVTLAAVASARHVSLLRLSGARPHTLGRPRLAPLTATSVTGRLLVSPSRPLTDGTVRFSLTFPPSVVGSATGLPP